MSLYKKLIFPFLSNFDAERTHDTLVRVLELGQRSSMGRYILENQAGELTDKPVNLFGLNFPNRLGIAAGFDKDARISAALAMLGFGHIEVGTITPTRQAGNERPRIFRLKNDRGLINRMGFPNQGAAHAAVKLSERPCIERKYVLGVSLGKQKETPLEEAALDYTAVMGELYGLADYFAINVSSPNTPGLQHLQGPQYLDELLDSISVANEDLSNNDNNSAKPILLKISPDLTFSEIDQILATALSKGISGLIAANTSRGRKGLVSNNMSEGGGLSGKPISELSNKMISHIIEATDGKMPVIGVGGVFTADDVRRKIDAGAALVQIYTGLIYEGPSIAGIILRELATQDLGE